MDASPSVDLPPSSSTDVAGSSSHPPCRCEYPLSDEDAVEEPGLFDAATYILHSHRLGFGGFLQYCPSVGGPEAGVVYREPEQHLSVLNVLVDPRLWERIGALEWFLGKVPSLHSRGHVDVAWLSKTYMTVDILTQVSVEQLTRAFLLYLFGQTLFVNKDGSVHTQLLAPLQRLEAVREFDWALFALATLYGNLGACSLDKSPILGSHYRAIKVCFDPWSGVLEDALFVRSRALDRTRSLLKGPFCRAWYLGDQVASQWHPPAQALQFVPLFCTLVNRIKPHHLLRPSNNLPHCRPLIKFQRQMQNFYQIIMWTHVSQMFPYHDPSFK
ncbi:hypothetical protein RHMOL_Rhmol08G0218800 [Rhododendron molle]|uniref:Uncharacterized protein n=1 Tax=Rhododendron molle TaxID=49168 RepID=A0ACC0MSI7_RHOML|nr:hypothetical protein RHMOL_Rhmol08G0218800 [Rhododendron molle]